MQKNLGFFLSQYLLNDKVELRLFPSRCFVQTAYQLEQTVFPQSKRSQNGVSECQQWGDMWWKSCIYIYACIYRRLYPFIKMSIRCIYFLRYCLCNVCIDRWGATGPSWTGCLKGPSLLYMEPTLHQLTSVAPPLHTSTYFVSHQTNWVKRVNKGFDRRIAEKMDYNSKKRSLNQFGFCSIWIMAGSQSGLCVLLNWLLPYVRIKCKINSDFFF